MDGDGGAIPKEDSSGSMERDSSIFAYPLLLLGKIESCAPRPRLSAEAELQDFSSGSPERSSGIPPPRRRSGGEAGRDSRAITAHSSSPTSRSRALRLSSSLGLEYVETTTLESAWPSMAAASAAGTGV